MFKLHSVKSMVSPVTNTGRERRRITAVISGDQTNNGVRYCVVAVVFFFLMVVIKLIAPKIDDTPAKCREKIIRSTDALE